MPILLAFIKDGVIQMMALMMIYGTLIPNPPAVAARTLLAMFAGPVLAADAHEDASRRGQILEQLSAAEEAGSNILFLAIGAVLAFYGSYLLNGLRTELHDGPQVRPVPAAQEDRRGGHGRGLPRRAPAPEAPLRLKLIKPEAGHQPPRPRPVRARGPVGRPALAPQHDRDLRLRPHRRRHVLLRDGIPPRHEPATNWSSGPAPCRRVGRSTCSARPAPGWPRPTRWAWSTAT